MSRRASARPFTHVLASVASATLSGAVGRPVSVEVHVSNGLPGFTIVGLPEAAVRESRDRVRAAILSSGLPWPQRRVTVNLAPAAVHSGNHGATSTNVAEKPPNRGAGHPAPRSRLRRRQEGQSDRTCARSLGPGGVPSQET